jgi:hypothetical protein
MALILGVSIVAGHVLPPTGSSSSDGFVRIAQAPPPDVSIATTATAAAAAATRGAASAPAGPDSSRPQHGRHHNHGGGNCSNCGSHSPSSTSVGVDVGPVHAGVTVSDDAAAVSVSAGPVRVHRKVKTPPVKKVVDTAGKTVCTLVSC